MRPRPPSHTVTPAEVKTWFGQRADVRLSESSYRAIAKKLNELRWPADPIERRAKPSPDRDPYWDFGSATKAAKLLLGAMPAMRRHWQGLTWAPQKRDGYPATVALERALRTALPFIEWPFGRYQRQKGRKQRKPWQVPAIIVAKILIASGCKPSVGRHAVLVRATYKGLERMGYKLTVGISGMSAYLERWHKRYGLIPKRNQR